MNKISECLMKKMSLLGNSSQIEKAIQFVDLLKKQSEAQQEPEKEEVGTQV